jgi:hypothetical protein
MNVNDDPTDAEGADRSGGDAACWAHLVCPECGAVTTEGHLPGCALAESVEPWG